MNKIGKLLAINIAIRKASTLHDQQESAVYEASIYVEYLWNELTEHSRKHIIDMNYKLTPHIKKMLSTKDNITEVEMRAILAMWQKQHKFK